MKQQKRALLVSVTAMLLSVAMLVGTTLAWFSDSAASTRNIIETGTLDVELEYIDAAGQWAPVTEQTALFDADTLWEPGHTQVVYLRVANKGTLALQYKLGVNVLKEVGSTNKAGKSFYLSNYIQFGVVEGVSSAFASRDAARMAVGQSAPLSAGYADIGYLPAGAADPQTVALVVYMPESVGNEANPAVGAGDPRIELGIELYATQDTVEKDSFDENYDAEAGYPKQAINVTTSMPVAGYVDETGTIVEPMAIGNAATGVTAVVPQGVVLAEGTTALTLSVQEMETSQAAVTLQQGETKTSLDVHVDGLAEGNTTPVLVTLTAVAPTNLNKGNLTLYHVENGATVPMTEVDSVDQLTAHNQFFYDPDDGTVVLSMASFSEVAMVADMLNPWNGGVDYSWYTNAVAPLAGEAAADYVIANADQLAGFGAIVDGTAEGIAQDSFANKTVTLSADIDLNKQLFDPIGYGYATRYMTDGKAFKGTFDGGNHTIYNLYQNGWDLGYSYSMAGGGLFASVANAAIQNLTISGANIRMECIDMGVLVGYSQGNCTYENIKIYNSKIANYQRATGGVVGEVSPLWTSADDGATWNAGSCTHTFTDVVVHSNVVVGSLWGDFDAPVGGVIGARWDDANVTSVVMENVKVYCRLDVYNDITSTYQWHAYRRAGMLIGNTDTPPADGKNSKVATADFLTCTNVLVRYGDWVNYHYCEFSNHNSNWPWVRVEAGENCAAYSNPRYGVPNDPETGAPVTTLDHNHTNGDEHNVEKEFNQLYGGGQGVYGQPTHAGVTTNSYVYTITYINNSKVLGVDYVEDNESAFVLNDSQVATSAVEAAETAMGTGYEFSHWMNAGSTRIDSLDAGHTEDVVLYPSFVGVYTAMFVDQQGNVLAWDTYTRNNYGNITAKGENTTPPAIKDCEFDYWQVRIGDNKTAKLSEYKFTDNKDVTIYPIYTYNGDVNLIPVDNNGDGITDEYQVGGYSDPNGADLVEIPNTFNGKPVTAINAKAFSSYEGVHSVVIPQNVTSVGANTLAEKWGWLDSGETVTLYYAGSYEEWKEKEENFDSNWDSGLGSASRIFFLNGGDTVDVSQGYLQAKVNGYSSNTKYVSWDDPQTVTVALKTEYTGNCDCGCGIRPDAKYWEGVTIG